MENRAISNNLPVALSTFIGREREVAEVKRWLSTHRLLTLTGSGGCGKSRLALHVAGQLAASYEGGVWLVELAPLVNAALLPQAVALACGAREQPGRPLLDTLAQHLRRRASLLILDNCEHLIAACAHLAEALLRACPHLSILATSREPLAVPGEATWAVPPLSLPQRQPWHSPTSGEEALPLYAQSEAVRLFTERAAAASQDFTLTAENGAWVAEICRRLDGLPLAIELAAARVRALSVRQIAERLDDRFHLLTTGSRTAPPRHQTLAAALDWSYALLSASEQKVLQRLSVFAGGCTLEAAEHVCAGAGVEAGAVLDILSNLIAKSLITAGRSDDRRRYQMLETIRQYAYQKLAESQAADSIRDRHLDYFLSWAETAAIPLAGPEQPEWLARFEAEHDNLRAALEWSRTIAGREEQGLRLATASGHFWRLRSYLSEGRTHLAAALDRPGAQGRTAARAWALLRAANLAYLQSDYPATQLHAEEALHICRELGPAGQAGVARALDLLAEKATEVGDYETAPLLLEEALIIYRELNDKRGIADMLMQLGWAAMRAGDYQRAEALLDECLPLFRELDESSLLGLALGGLGELAIRQERFDRAEEFLQSSLALRRALGERWGMATALGSLGWVALLQRDFGRLREQLGASVAIRMEIGDPGGVAWCLEKLAEAIMVESEALARPKRLKGYHRAGRVFGAAAALRASRGSVIDPADQHDYERHLATLRALLGEEAFAAAWAEGEAAALDDIVAAALAAPETPAGSDPSSTPAEKESFGGLTPRERQTAAFIAQGKSNRDIAAAMSVQVKTIETYVTRILNKLGFDSRVQIATWAVEKGLDPGRNNAPGQ